MHRVAITVRYQIIPQPRFRVLQRVGYLLIISRDGFLSCCSRRLEITVSPTVRSITSCNANQLDLTGVIRPSASPAQMQSKEFLILNTSVQSPSSGLKFVLSRSPLWDFGKFVSKLRTLLNDSRCKVLQSILLLAVFNQPIYVISSPGAGPDQVN